MSHIIILSLTFGHLTLEKTVEFLDTSIEGCTNETFSSGIVKPTSQMFISLAQHKPIEVSNWMEKQDVISTTPASMHDYSQFPQNVFAISYMYYSLFGTMITVFVGMAVSLLTQSEDDAYDSKFIHPVVYRMAKWFPKSEKLFSKEHSTTEIKNCTLKDPIEQHYNEGFDTNSEEMGSNSIVSKQDDINAVNFKSNIVYKSELEIPRLENYKKLSEDSQFN